MTTLTVRRQGVYTVAAPDAWRDPTKITSVRLGLAGGTLVFDVSETDPVPAIEVFDIDAASWWLFSLYGVAAAEEIVAFALRTEVNGEAEEGEGQATTIHAVQGALSDRLRRLALALWLRRWWPEPSEKIPACPEWLLDVEAGVLADGLEHALDREIALPERLLEPHLERLAVNLADHDARLDGSTVDSVIDRVLIAAARVALEISDPDATGFDTLDTIEQRVRITDTEVSALRAGLDDDAGVAALIAELRATADEEEDVFELTLGGDDPDPELGNSPETPVRRGSSSRSGTAPVDPRAVPARLLSTSEHAITWTLDETAESVGCHITVQPAAGADLHNAGQFFVRVDHGGVTSVTALRRLDGLLKGTVWLDGTADRDEILVNVYSDVDGYDPVVPRSSEERRKDSGALAKLVAARILTAESAAADPGRWDGPFAAELIDAARITVR